jgi:uncharacterized cupin superfamily protein
MSIVHIKAPAELSRETLSPAGTPPNPAGGEPVRLSLKEAFAAPDERINTGVWEATPGQFRRAVMDAEFCHFIAGHATFVSDAGQRFEFRAGDAAYFPPRTLGTWTIHETLRKTYVVWKDIPRGPVD